MRGDDEPPRQPAQCLGERRLVREVLLEQIARSPASEGCRSECCRPILAHSFGAVSRSGSRAIETSINASPAIAVSSPIAHARSCSSERSALACRRRPRQVARRQLAVKASTRSPRARAAPSQERADNEFVKLVRAETFRVLRASPSRQNCAKTQEIAFLQILLRDERAPLRARLSQRASPAGSARKSSQTADRNALSEPRTSGCALELTQEEREAAPPLIELALDSLGCPARRVEQRAAEEVLLLRKLGQPTQACPLGELAQD